MGYGICGEKSSMTQNFEELNPMLGPIGITIGVMKENAELCTSCGLCITTDLLNAGKWVRTSSRRGILRVNRFLNISSSVCSKLNVFSHQWEPAALEIYCAYGQAMVAQMEEACHGLWQQLYPLFKRKDDLIKFLS